MSYIINFSLYLMFDKMSNTLHVWKIKYCNDTLLSWRTLDGTLSIDREHTFHHNVFIRENEAGWRKEKRKKRSSSRWTWRAGLYFGRRLPIAHGFRGGRAVRVTTCTFRISVCLLLSIGSTTATPTITNGIIYEFEHEPELFRKPLRCIRTLVTFSEYRDKSWDLGDLATFWNFIMIRLELKMHNDAHGLHNNHTGTYRKRLSLLECPFRAIFVSLVWMMVCSERVW